MSFIKESKNAYKQVQENHIAIAMGQMLDDEGSMILNQLEELERAIKMIRTYVGTDYEKQLPAWVQAKVTLASDYISTVGNYLSGKNEKATEEAIKEEFDLEEASLTSIHKMKEDGKTAEEIAKELKLNAGLVKKILGEEVELKEFTDAMLAALKKEYDPLKGKTITTSQYQQLKNILLKLQDGDLEKLQKQNIPFASTGAGSILRVRKSPVKITNIKVPGLENMAEEATFWWHDGKTGYVKAGYDNKELLAWLKKNGYKPEKDIKEEVDMSKVTKYKMISIKGDQKEITIDRKDLEKHLKLGYVIKEPLTEETLPVMSGSDSLGYNVKYKVKKSDQMISVFWSKEKNLAQKFLDDIKKTGGNGIITAKEEVELKSAPSLEDSAKKHNVDVETLKKQLEKGIEIEKEHTKDEKVAEKIALAHIDERPDYYIQIDKLEKKPIEKVEEACWTGYKKVGLKKKGKKMVPNCVPEETIREQKRLYIESIAAVKNKAEKTGMSYSILKQVYDRGMAAWKGGHRPGTTQVQWALARVNSFVTKSSGTWGGADSDLAKKVKG
jgi:oligoribonuclease (3'-5' exoribonuclease)